MCSRSDLYELHIPTNVYITRHKYRVEIYFYIFYVTFFLKKLFVNNCSESPADTINFK